MASNTHQTASRQRTQSLGILGLVGGVFIALNIIGIFVFKRVDVTEKQAFTLSQGSRRLVHSLPDELKVTGYFTDNLPPPHNATVRYVRDILAEYQASSNGRMRVRFVSPDTDEEKREAQERGVQLTINRAVNDNAVQDVEGFRGIVFEYHGNRQTIPVVQSTEGLEYLITMQIKQILGNRADIGIVSGHDGPTLAQGLSKLQQVLPHYNVREVSAASEIDRNLKALIIVDPHTAFSDDELRYINQYVMRGGSLAIFGGAMKVDLQGAPEFNATPTNSGLNRLLEAWGIRMQNNIIADEMCEPMPMQDPSGFPRVVAHPPLVVAAIEESVATNATVPVLYRLPQMRAFFTSSLETTPSFASNGGVVLVKSSENSWALTGDTVSLRPRIGSEWRSTLTQRPGQHNLAAVVHGRLPSAFSQAMSQAQTAAPSSIQAPERAEREVRVVVFGSSLFLNDMLYGNGQQQAPLEQVAAAMAPGLNAIDYLAQDSDLIAVRAKSGDDPELEVPQGVQRAQTDAIAAAEQGERDEVRAAIERGRAEIEKWNSRKKFIQWVNTLGVPLVFAVIAFLYATARKAKMATLKP